MEKIVAKSDYYKDNVKQMIGFRIWNVAKTNILVHLLEKSAAWTLPSMVLTPGQDTTDKLLLLLDQFPGAELSSAICILNIKETIPIQFPENTTFTDVSLQYIIYDIEIEPNNVRQIYLPKNVKGSLWLKIDNTASLIHKTPILNHIVKYMKEKQAYSYMP